MSYFFKNIKPGLESDEDDELDDVLSRTIVGKNKFDEEDELSDDEMKTLSFGSLKKAESMLDEEDGRGKKKVKNSERDAKIVRKGEAKTFREEAFSDSDDSNDDQSDSEGDSDGAFFEEENGQKHQQRKMGKHKHAPAEQSSKKRVSKIRQIPGIKNQSSNLYQDIRFDRSLGDEADVAKIRRRYKFLDEYREKEIEELQGMLHDRKFMSKITDKDRDEMQNRLVSMKSKLQTIKNKDLEQQIVKEYENKINESNNSRYHLKNSEKRKVIQKWKFDHMKAKQREKVMERKRKKRLGKEFKQFEFHQR
ncbi:hypothetical protein KAFR_0A04260 [Kazachstania africana CBS 2517]|uniref:rRNA biogenesis protein RRP36 n=1 Tax=Kazachstania africana (strain ATCC 22294 / BCRC 22015 / CBS 2517 / CECT 1963 / NBRC 1671 / NRRL Y-8276) TaxID=1071382 RepID=H2ANB1_KAZAF|nr:hypothetical protein KAFR_0A04260 [Kazachstania africana CBS 2517]CCF55861.1 hypothetical protein KAFR_0A04260 [Kazachstania africana CBS 2517]